ncbi:hypothetical protein roselon_00395 [Roseibacterium elongatum DSM 19469]|uniref:Peptidase MA-like domain-containing protein n=1 Tax=Roseicyclus elongatus DSM 19469 TaxID=1294273 RepID=W8SK05_9RHOB|nr:hypothetical protein [Roseibacterium elongatum]AHM02840.1 hypothetical protein roselon_00395 [Roseibacterium elongatum DSM 19469]
MSYARMVRWVFRFSVTAFALVLSIYLATVALIAWPAPLFSHERQGGALTFHAQAPLPGSAERMGQEVTALLAASPLGPPEDMHVWLVEGGLALRVFFVGSTRASGLTYPVASRANIFLRHADFDQNRLVRAGQAVPPPRTLSYYLVHEATHLQLVHHAGRLAITRIPHWINEGFADYVALGPAPPVMVALAAAGRPLPRDLFGTYPRERVCVTLALEWLGGDLDALLAMRAEMGPEGACPLVPQFAIAPAHGGT